ncbi:39S ribosomal protein L54, mitochondrial isoform X1 [Callorhinchus milii]|uniref:Large ribosomal subunit protein mL54 n=1 Tax=Callorhinchus milii TaxID=7868 RepID=A0A4W3GPF0_CALMI|nr:39S ribosomal protein L54, mitochondrial isoform X1 [Callorhinchus milii]|eukprot:gi/632978931/ref/XP_007906186.1/ PREDICTED: 39S ribosomal protein L54, mitochondrial isoform X1 [Callorhinchus milii]
MAARSGLQLGRWWLRGGGDGLLRPGPPARGYAKKAAVKGKGKMGVKEVLKGPEVCTDPFTLTTRAVGVNVYKQGTDPELKPRSEYPEWLFTLNLGPPKKLEELDPESREYWNLLRKHHMWQFNKLHKGKKL